MASVMLQANGSIFELPFDENRITLENSLTGSPFVRSNVDHLKDLPERKKANKLYNFGSVKEELSGTFFGIVTKETRVLFDEDPNNTQSGAHFNIQLRVHISGLTDYQIPAGSLHRIYETEIEIFCCNPDGSISGTKLVRPKLTCEIIP